MMSIRSSAYVCSHGGKKEPKEEVGGTVPHPCFLVCKDCVAGGKCSCHICLLNSDSLIRYQALSGQFCDETKWRTPSWKLLVFVSSTFTDTHRERDYLMKELLPELQKEAQTNEIEVTFIDMRFVLNSL